MLCKAKTASKLEVKGQKTEGSLSPVEEMQLLMSIHSQLEQQQSPELQYCMFEAIFGGSAADKQVPISFPDTGMNLEMRLDCIVHFQVLKAITCGF